MLEHQIAFDDRLHDVVYCHVLQHGGIREDCAITQDQKNLTTKYSVYYYSPTDGKLNNVESFTDTHVRVGSSDLPATRRIITYDNGQVIVKTLTFTNHKLI